MNVSIAKQMKLNRPHFVAAWPGMGNVAITALSYIKEKLGATLLTEIAPAEYFAPTGAVVVEQIIQAPESPDNKFFYYKNPDKTNDILFFIGTSQPVPHMEYAFARKILHLAHEFEVSEVITFAATPSDMHYKDTPRVFAVPNHQDLLQKAMEYHVHFLNEGNIAGMNGLLVSVAAEMGLKGMTLLGEIPFFTAQIEFPKAAIEIVKVVSKILNINIDLVDLEIYTRKKEKDIAPLAALLTKDEEQAQNAEPQDEEKIVPDSESETKVPESVRLIVEKMFRQAEYDDTYKSKMRLKEELDKWGLFDEYLDRFLDLFKKS
ncbi:PAC2 family protein [bacterium]|nr:PAC2 family protein [bacterium]